MGKTCDGLEESKTINCVNKTGICSNIQVAAQTSTSIYIRGNQSGTVSFPIHTPDRTSIHVIAA